MEEFSGSAYALTQLLRGSFFVATHSLLARSYDRDQENNKAAHNFILDFVSLVAHWLKLLPSLHHKLNEYHSHPSLFLVDKEVTLVSCAPEFFFLLRYLFNKDERNPSY